MSQSMPVPPASLKLLVDSTAWDPVKEERVIHQTIFDHMLTMISEAQQFVYLDFFLWNPWQGQGAEEHRALSGELADALIARKQAVPELAVLALTDPVNRIYGGHEPEFFERLHEAGIAVVFTDVDALPDSNRIYSAPARFYGPLLGRVGMVRRWLERPRWPNPLSPVDNDVSTIQIARLLFFKANHRKILITDGGTNGVMRMIVSSLNPADGSAAHSNLGIQLDGPLAAVALKNELYCVRWSAETSGHVLAREEGVVTELSDRLERAADLALSDVPFDASPIHGQWLTDGAIRERILEMLQGVTRDDHVRIGMFYLSDRGVVAAIKKAIASGAKVDMILDANKDAFGRTKNGIPNRPVAAELMVYAQTIPENRLIIRWADTHGEQYHSKVMTVTDADAARYLFLAGSANWTRRNIGSLNLEANVYLEGAEALTRAFNAYFDDTLSNVGNLQYTVPYDVYAETGAGSWLKKWRYRFQEASGACTF